MRQTLCSGTIVTCRRITFLSGTTVHRRVIACLTKRFFPSRQRSPERAFGSDACPTGVHKRFLRFIRFLRFLSYFNLMTLEPFGRVDDSRTGMRLRENLSWHILLVDDMSDVPRERFSGTACLVPGGAHRSVPNSFLLDRWATARREQVSVGHKEETQGGRQPVPRDRSSKGV